MSNRVFEELERARMHQDITKYRDIVFQILLYKYLDEVLLVKLLGNSLSDILEQIKDQADTSVLEDAFIEAEIIFQENIDEDFLNGIFDVSRLDRSFDKDSIMSAIDTLQKASFDEIDIDELVENYTLASGKANGYGESCTPVSLCKLIAGLLSVDGTDFKTIGEQSCGIASLAIEIGKTANNKRLYLQETNIDSIRMAKIIYLLQGGNVDDFFIEQGIGVTLNTYTHLGFEDAKEEVF